MSESSPKKPNILVVRPDALGDVVLTLPLIQSLYRTYPNANIYVLTQAYTQPVLSYHPAIHSVITDWKSLGRVRSIAQFRDYVDYIRSFRFSQVYLPYLDGFYALLSVLAQIPIRIGDGQKILLKPFLTHPVSLPTRELAYHATELLVQLVTKSHTHCHTDMESRLYIGREDELLAQYLLKEAGWKYEKLVAVHFGTGGNNRAWLSAHFADFIDRISHQFGVKVVLTGMGQEDIDKARHILSLCQSNPINLVGKTKLSALKGVLSRCKAFVATDTGPLHMAAALNIPVLCLSPTKFSKSLRYGPWLTPQQVVHDTQACHRVCRPALCMHTECLDSLTVSLVVSAFEKLLKTPVMGYEAIKQHGFATSATVAIYVDNATSTEVAKHHFLLLRQAGIPVCFIVPNQMVLQLFVGKIRDSVRVLPLFRLDLWIAFCIRRDITVLHVHKKPPVFWSWLLRQLTALRMYCPPKIVVFSTFSHQVEDLVKEYLRV